jgi:hypothetical protein
MENKDYNNDFDISEFKHTIESIQIDIQDAKNEILNCVKDEIWVVYQEIYNEIHDTKISFICELIIISYGVYGLIKIYKYFF